MKKIIITCLFLVLCLDSITAKNFLTPGTTDTAMTVNNQTTQAYFDLTPKLYNYHVFGFTSTINENPNMSFSSLQEIKLILKDANNKRVYVSEPNSLYFSYSYSGQKNYEVTFTGADLILMGTELKPNLPQAAPYFKTTTTVTYPKGYGSGTAVSEATGKEYNPVVVLPRTDSKDTGTFFGNYGSLKLDIVANFVKANGKGFGKDTTTMPDKKGYVGIFTLTCTSY